MAPGESEYAGSLVAVFSVYLVVCCFWVNGKYREDKREREKEMRGRFTEKEESSGSDQRMNGSPKPGVPAVCRTADEMQLLSAFNGCTNSIDVHCTWTQAWLWG